MSPRPPPRPPRRPLSVASSIVDYEGMISEHGRAQSPTPSIVVKDAWPMSFGMAGVASPKLNEPLAIGIVIEEQDGEESDETAPTCADRDTGARKATQTDTRKETPPRRDTKTDTRNDALQPVSRLPRPFSPARALSPSPHADKNNVFTAASALMAAVTSARGKNMIIGPCTCRTCSVGCLVALLAMATGRVEQLREDIAVEVYQQDLRNGTSGPSKDAPAPSTAVPVRLNEAGSKLRDLVRTMAHLQLRDKECRILQASATQFVVALPHVKVDYLRQRKRVTDTKAIDVPEEVKHEDFDLPTTPPLNLRKDPTKRSEVPRRPPRVEIPEGVGTGEFLGSAWGNYAWAARSGSIRSVSSASHRANRAANRHSRIGDDTMRMGALQVVLESAGIEHFEPSRVERLPGAASRIVVEQPQVPIAAPSSATVETKRLPPKRSMTFGDFSNLPPVSRPTSPQDDQPLSPIIRTASPPTFSSLESPTLSPSQPRTTKDLDNLSLSPSQPRTDVENLDNRPLSPSRPRTDVKEVDNLTPSPSHPRAEIKEVDTLTPLTLTSPSPQASPSRSGSPLPSPCPSPRPSRSRTPSPLPGEGEKLTRTAAVRAANKVKAARDAQRNADETTQLRNLLANANAEVERLRADRFKLEATIAELRGRLAATETMLDTYEDLTREVEEERRQLEADKFILELENARLEKKNSYLVTKI